MTAQELVNAEKDGTIHSMDVNSQQMQMAWESTFLNDINPQAMPELLRQFKIAVSLLAGYMADAYDAPQNDYNALEGFEGLIKEATLISK